MRNALVTGSSRGIGREIALELARRGFNVLINCIKNRRLAEQTAQEAAKIGVRADVFVADVSNYAEVKKMCEYAQKTFGFMDTVVNNAGISRYSLFTDDDEAAFDEVIGTNLKGVFNVSRLFVPDMISRKFGRIVNISSMWGVAGSACEALYSASKAGVIGLTKALAKELGPSGITVNAVAPGVIKTDMLASVSDRTLNSLIDDTPVLRCGTPSDVASAVAFLVSENSSFITGEVINCSGGFIM